MDRQRIAAVVAQFTQAGASLLLSVLAVRTLDPSGFGRYLLVTSTMILLTGATTGLIGDSLTVLDRSTATMRRTLQWGALTSAGIGGMVVLLLAGLLGWAAWPVAGIAGVAAATFVLEDLVRRALMANRRFGSVVLVDLTYAAVAVLIFATAFAVGSISLAVMFAAIAAGQVVASAVGVRQIPRADRRAVGMRGDVQVRELIGFGGWRALHLSVGPLKLWVIRLMVSGAAGFAAVGLLEANRLVMAPLMLAVQGTASALLVSQAAQVRRSPGLARAQADRDAAMLVLAVCAALLGLYLARVPIATLLLGSADLVDPLMLVGWGVVAVGMALNVPYSNLTAAAGAPRAAFAMRVWDLALAVLGIGALIILLPTQDWLPMVPMLIGVVSCALAVAQRRVALGATRGPAE